MNNIAHSGFFLSLLVFCCHYAYAGDAGSMDANAGSPSPVGQPRAPTAEFDALKAKFFPFYTDDWSIYSDATAIVQGYPAYRASYSGAQSLPSSSQTRNLEVADLFIGRRLWEGGEVYIDPQFYRGFGLNGTIGLAGFADGEGNKGGTQYIYPELGRAFWRQTVGLGGASETLERGPNQLHDVVDISRFTLTAGKFSYTDQFDNNAYSHDPETQFMNWSFMDSLAWDWAQDSKGYAWGAVAELNRENWALRYGAMAPTDAINGDRFGLHGVNALDNAVELEERYSLSGKPGKTRILGFYNRERAGDFAEALSMGRDIDVAIADTREYGRVEYGFALNLEQQLMEDLGAFARLSWNNGAIENFGFTQADQSAAVGVSLQGSRWGRGDDVAGLAFAVNGVSNAQRKALEAGYDTGLIIGDGSLSYSGETIMEAYYNCKLADYASIGPDYQFVLNPAYNADRGPVNIFALRMNAKF